MKMKSWRFHETGHIQNLQLEEVDMPQPAADEALVKVEYAGLNPADKFVVMGRYPGSGTPPFSVGRDGCGVIEKPGDSGRFKRGDRVVLLRSTIGITRDGTLAQFAAIPEKFLAPIPPWWDAVDGAGGPLVMLTNWQALAMAARVKSGERVVITGASGGIGTSALVLSKALGTKVIALSRSAEKREKLAEMGADQVMDPNDPDLVKRIKADGGADVIIENICGVSLGRSVEMANMYGRICIIGGLGGVKSEINAMHVLFKRLQIHGIQVGEYSDAEVHAAWENIVKTLKPGKLKVPVDKVFPFDQVQEAFEHMRNGPMGKVVVGPMNPT